MYKWKLVLIFCLVLGLGDMAVAVPQTVAQNTDRPANQKEKKLAKSTAAHAFRIENHVVLDGRLDDPIWDKAVAISDFTQHDPNEGEPASLPTEVYISYDDAAIYIGARMHDTAPDSIIKQLARRDVDLTADMFGFYVDPYNDNQTGFYFGVNAAGTRYDGTLYNDDWDDNSWDGVWEARTQIDDEGWTVEMRIPYSQLRFKKSDQYVWGVNFSRFVARRNEWDYKVIRPKNSSGFVSRFIDLEGIKKVDPPRHFEVIPYVTSKASYLDVESGNPFNDGSQYSMNAGADIRTTIAGNLTLNATINPDFGQVEVDPAVVNLSDFETFFPEKRPFFIEGNSYFNYGRGGSNNYWSFNWGDPDYFYTRRIGRRPQGELPDNDYADVPEGTSIIGAAKVTGRLDGGWNVGSVQALTSSEQAHYQMDGTTHKMEVEPTTYYGVMRARKEFNEARQAVGFIGTYTNRYFSNNSLEDELNKNAFTFGLDGWTFLDKDKEWVVTGALGMSRLTGTQEHMQQLQGSSLHYLQRPDRDHYRIDSSATSMTGYMGRFYLNKQKGNMFLNAAFGFIDPRFDVNDLGYMWVSDAMNMHVAGGYYWTEPTSWYRMIEFGAAVFQTNDFDGNTTWKGVYHYGTYQMLNYHRIRYNVAYNPPTLDNHLTRGGPLTANPTGWQFDLNYSTDSRKKLVGGADYGFYQTDADEISSYVNLSLEWKPVPKISFEVDPRYEYEHTQAQYVDTFDDAYATETFGKRYVFGEMVQHTISAGIRANWTFTPRLSLQLYAQPLISSGDYMNFRELAEPRTYDFNEFGNGSSTISQNDETYRVDPDGAGPAAAFEFDNPDFNFKSLRGNAVLRWEYRPGSTLYLVWTQSRSRSDDYGRFDFNNSLDRLLGAKPDNIFLLKATFWFNP